MRSVRLQPDLASVVSGFSRTRIVHLKANTTSPEPLRARPRPITSPVSSLQPVCYNHWISNAGFTV